MIAPRLTRAAADMPKSRPYTRPMPRTVVLRPYEDRDLQGTLELRPRVYPGWKDASDAAWHTAVYAWLGQNPVDAPTHRWVLDDGGSIVGHLAAVPLRNRIRRVVRPALRGSLGRGAVPRREDGGLPPLALRARDAAAGPAPDRSHDRRFHSGLRRDAHDGLVRRFHPRPDDRTGTARRRT